MIICLCNCITDQDIDDAMQKGNNTIEDILKYFDTKHKCASCEQQMQKIVDEANETVYNG